MPPLTSVVSSVKQPEKSAILTNFAKPGSCQEFGGRCAKLANQGLPKEQKELAKENSGNDKENNTYDVRVLDTSGEKKLNMYKKYQNFFFVHV